MLYNKKLAGFVLAVIISLFGHSHATTYWVSDAIVLVGQDPCVPDDLC